MTSRPSNIIDAMRGLLWFFEERCEDNATLGKLVAIADDSGRWQESHDLFLEIRKKTLAAEKAADSLALAQRAFEEICAKTLYNLSRPSAPFDADSPFWILPMAVALGRELGFTDVGQISPLLRLER